MVASYSSSENSSDNAGHDACNELGCRSYGNRLEHEKTLSRLCEVVVRLEKDGERREKAIEQLRKQQGEMTEQLFDAITVVNEKINDIRNDIKKDSEQTKLWLIALLLTILGSIVTFVVTSVL